MTLMLASVTGPQEADIAVDHGADIVDVKDVGAGFGRVDAALVRATAEAVTGRRPVSAVQGSQRRRRRNKLSPYKKDPPMAAM